MDLDETLSDPHPYADDRIIKALESAHAITWDECHKVYISADPKMTKQFKKIGYPMTLIKNDVNDAAITLQEWYDDSCPLKFIQKVHSPGNNEDYENVIPQFDDEEEL